VKKQEEEEEDVVMTTEQRQEYDRILEEAGKQSAVQTQQLHNLERSAFLRFPPFHFFLSLFRGHCGYHCGLRSRQHAIDDSSLQMMRASASQLEERKAEVLTSKEALSQKVIKIKAELSAVQEKKAAIALERTGKSFCL